MGPNFPFLDRLHPVLSLASRRLCQQARELFVYETNLEEALQCVDAGLYNEPHNVQALVLRADILFCLKDDTGALQTLHRALRLQPGCIEALLSQGSVLESMGRLHDALRINRLALGQLASRHRYLLPTLYQQQMNLLVQLKQTPQALALLHKAQGQLPRQDHDALKADLAALLRQARNTRPRHTAANGERITLRVITGQAS